MRKITIIVFIFCSSLLFAESLEESILKNAYTMQNIQYKVDNLELINNKLLNSIYVTIGAFSLLILAFIAVNIIAGIQTKKKELENIRNELENIINKNIEQQNTILLEYKEIVKNELLKSVDSKIKLIDSEYNKKIDKLDSSINTNRKDQLELANRLEKSRYSFLSNILEIIEIDLKNVRSWEINDSLDSLIEYLREKEIPIDDADTIKKLLNKIPEDYSLRKKEIEKQIKIEK